MKKEMCAALCACVVAAGNVTAAERPSYTAEEKDLNKTLSLPLLVSANRPDALGRCGEKIVFSISPVQIPPDAAKIRLFQWRNGLRIAVSEHEISDFSITMSSADAAHLMVTAVYIDRSGAVISPPPVTKGYGDGVFIDPDGIRRARPRPADFDTFWDNELRKLAQTPLISTRKPVKKTPLWQCDDVTVDSGSDIPVRGYLVTPVKSAPRSLPAVVYFHGAGFKSSQIRSDFKDRAIVFDVNAHGIANGMPRNFYRDLNLNPPAGRNVFDHRGNREKSYFKDMFLRTARALEFVKSLPQWDGKTLIVAGRSQGGAQALAAAALDKDVTLCIANVPALADHGAKAAARKPGWPEINPENRQDIASASDYIDIINLASRIRCETVMSIGMIDAICPPSSVYLAYKELKTKKSITLFPQLGHNAPPEKQDGRNRIKKEILP